MDIEFREGSSAKQNERASTRPAGSYQSSQRRRRRLAHLCREKRHRQTDRQTATSWRVFLAPLERLRLFEWEDYFGISRLLTPCQTLTMHLACISNFVEGFSKMTFTYDEFQRIVMSDSAFHALYWIKKRRYFYTIKTLVTPRSKSATDRRRAKCR